MIRTATAVNIQSFGRLTRALLCVTVVSAGALLTGCVGQGEYDNLYETNRSLTDRNARLSQENQELKLALERLQSTSGRGEGTIADMQRRISELERLLAQAESDNRALGDRIAGLNFGPLTPEADAALRELAAKYPNLITYDSARGMLRFASDLTFASGSAEVQAQAKEALKALGEILNSSAASQYDVVVEGHTDSQRIANPVTIREHRTNRRLSAHRSIAVIDELGAMGVAPSRMLASGWGEYRPAVPNTPNGNTPQNRRVEIYLARSTRPAGAPAPSAQPDMGVAPDNAAPPARPRDISK